MQSSGDHGLKPANYWALGMDDLSQSYDVTSIARRDLVLTAATLRYASDIYNGRYPQSLKNSPLSCCWSLMRVQASMPFSKVWRLKRKNTSRSKAI
jgi:hypothetical protein